MAKDKNPAAALREEIAPAAAAPAATPDKASPAEPMCAAAMMKRFQIELKHTCGEGTIRPPMLVEVLLADAPAPFKPIDKDKPHNGLRVAIQQPGDMTQVALLAHEAALDAFNRFYGILETTHKHRVKMLSEDLQPAA